MMRRILVAGDFRYNSGSSHVIYNYFKTAGQLGYEFALSSTLGSLDAQIRQYMPVIDDLSWADYLILVFEANQYLTTANIDSIKHKFSSTQVVIIDPDGRYGPTITHQSDSNHSHVPHSTWINLFDHLSCKILTPRLSLLPRNTQFFPYFGMEYLETGPDIDDKPYTVQYIGNNWYRWETIRRFLEALESNRTRFGSIAVRGKWWDGQSRTGFEAATASDSTFLKRLDIQVNFSVPFGTVISWMSKSLISPIFVRLMISAQRLITPRMFETVCAHTIPIFGTSDQYITTLFGNGAESLIYTDPASHISQILDNLDYYFSLANDIRHDLFERFNYKVLVRDLVDILNR